MSNTRLALRASGLLGLAVVSASGAAVAWTPLPVDLDPLVRMPGNQESDGILIEASSNCMGCHAGYQADVEPGFNWQGSMMSNAMRDPIFWATVTVAAQDSIWAAGRPNATDICLRCHSPAGWLGGHSDPTNGSAMTGADFDGISCDFCHSSYDPFFEDTAAGLREGSDWLGYWDETNNSSTPSNTAAATTLAADRSAASGTRMFNGSTMFVANRPRIGTWSEAGSGQYFVSTSKNRRASFADAVPKHQLFYSRFHKSKHFCGTCHDVSNPVLANLAHKNATPGDGTTVLPTEQSPASALSHVERTQSEFMLSAYGLAGGSEGVGPYAPGVFKTSRPGNKIAACQDCHMADTTGAAANKNSAVLRPTDSVEHPKSGLPKHDMQGGNLIVPRLLASTVQTSPN
ncbi:MAG TPA: multiheme c-type cytochrome [Polyangiaceae bacterium]|nr:multiheme c-type cytochrome [Polyangiaceae bacterium]